jgi:hypothetical protein
MRLLRAVADRSRSTTVAALAAETGQHIEQWSGSEPADFVTRSLGGILLRVMVADGHLPNSADVVAQVMHFLECGRFER